MTPWDLPFVALFGLAVFAIVGDGRGLGPLERALGYFGIGGLAAGVALAELLAVSGAAGLAFAAIAERHLGGPGPATLALSAATATGVGLVWLRLRSAFSAGRENLNADVDVDVDERPR